MNKFEDIFITQKLLSEGFTLPSITYSCAGKKTAEAIFHATLVQEEEKTELEIT